jgi:hypothetical protein
VNQVCKGITFAPTGLTIQRAGYYRIGGNILLSGAGGTGSYAAFTLKASGVAVGPGSVGPGMAWMNFAISATVLLAVGAVLTFTVNTEVSSAKTDNRMSITVQHLTDS